MAVAYLVGAYTADMGGAADGIAALGRLADGSLEPLGTAVVADSPGYLAAHGGLVYAAAEGTGRVESFRPGPGIRLERVASADAGGSYPCHIAGYGDTVVAACYGDGALGVLSADPLHLAAAVPAEPGSGPHEAQDGPHAHATFALDDATVVSADLGADLLHLHSLADGVLTRTGSFALPPGTGPRDFLRLSDGRILVLGELSLTVLELSWHGGELEIVDEVALPGAQPGDHAAALTASADGRFAYAGLRGSNLISVLGVEHGLSALTSVASGGDWPRHHVVDGDVMHVAHERSHSVASFRIPENGIPEQIAPPIRVFSPIFLLRVP